MTTKTVKLESGATYSRDQEGRIHYRRYGSSDVGVIETEDVAELFEVVDGSKSIREAKREGFGRGMAYASRRLRNEGLVDASTFLSNGVGGWDAIADTLYPEPVKYREAEADGTRYRYREGVLEVLTKTGEWKHSYKDIDSLLALADIIKKPVEDN